MEIKLYPPETEAWQLPGKDEGDRKYLKFLVDQTPDGTFAVRLVKINTSLGNAALDLEGVTVLGGGYVRAQTDETIRAEWGSSTMGSMGLQEKPDDSAEAARVLGGVRISVEEWLTTNLPSFLSSPQ